MELYPVIAALALLVGFFVWERRSRQGAEAASLVRGASDRGSTTLVAGVFALGFVLLPVSLLLTTFGVGWMNISQVVALGGLMTLLLGIALRVWASQALGRFYTHTLRVAAEQQVVRDGPYRVVRHPGYLGSILMWVGAGLATLNWIAFACLALAALIAYIYRISVEEAMLRQTLGEPYSAYMAHTWRLLPHVY